MNMRAFSRDEVVSTVVPWESSVEVGGSSFTNSHMNSNTSGDTVLNKRKEYVSDQNSYPPHTRNSTEDTSHNIPVPPSENAGVSPFDLLFDRQDIHQEEGISLEEFAAAWSKAIKDRFAKLNANGDGVSSKGKRVTNRNDEGHPSRSPREPPV